MLLDLTSTSQLVQKDKLYGVKKNGELVAWLQLGADVDLFGEMYSTISMIYVVPGARKTRVVGLFLLGLQKVLKHRLILGSDEYGGVLFKGGVELVKALGDSARFTVQALDLRSGDLTNLTPRHLKTAKNVTLVFESDVPLYKQASDTWRIYLFEDAL